jgi:hypothetical protein
VQKRHRSTIANARWQSVKTLGHIPLAVGHGFPHRLWKACGKATVDIQEHRVVIADSPVCTDVVRTPAGRGMRAAPNALFDLVQLPLWSIATVDICSARDKAPSASRVSPSQ